MTTVANQIVCVGDCLGSTVRQNIMAPTAKAVFWTCIITVFLTTGQLCTRARHQRRRRSNIRQRRWQGCHHRRNHHRRGSAHLLNVPTLHTHCRVAHSSQASVCNAPALLTCQSLASSSPLGCVTHYGDAPPHPTTSIGYPCHTPCCCCRHPLHWHTAPARAIQRSYQVPPAVVVCTFQKTPSRKHLSQVARRTRDRH